MLRKIVVFPRIVVEIVKFAKSLLMVGYEFPASVSIHRGVCPVGHRDCIEKFTTDRLPMIVSSGITAEQRGKGFALNVVGNLHTHSII